MEKEIKITPPEGYEIDKENSTLECIKFKAIQNKKRWRDDINAQFNGYYMDIDSNIRKVSRQWNVSNAHRIFATEKQAKSALAMARISQIMANDERFGGIVTDEEWNNANQTKFVIERMGDEIYEDEWWKRHAFLAFHTRGQRNLFLKENEDLVRDYLMFD